MTAADGSEADNLTDAASDKTAGNAIDGPAGDDGAAKLVSLEVRGFRAFGVEARTMQTDEPLIVLHAGNSQGKTSLAEALEFLISGRSSRRELLGGAKAEYDGSLRNAHLPSGDDEVYVEAMIRDPSGVQRRVRRTLLSDFGRGTECASQLLVDGAEAEDLSSVGIVLADGPVRAPVLLQHILRHVLSTEPKQRVGYFKALLELTDLDQLRERVKALRVRTDSEQPGAALRWATALTGASLPAMAAELSAAVTKPITTPDATQLVDHMLLAAGQAILTASPSPLSIGLQAGQGENDRSSLAGTDSGRETGELTDLAALSSALDHARDEHRERSFPMAPFRAAVPPTGTPPWPDLSGYSAALAAADQQAARLAPVITAVLAIDTYSDLHAPADCPVCGTADALTTDRVHELHELLDSTRRVDEAAAAATRAITSARGDLDDLGAAVGRSVPPAAAWNDQQLSGAAARAAELGVDDRSLRAAHAAAMDLGSARDAFDDAIDAARHSLSDALARLAAREPATDQDSDAATPISALAAALDVVVERSAAYDAAATELRLVIDAATVDSSAVPGIREVSDLLARRTELIGDLVTESARQRTVKRIAAAERALREAAGKVLDTRFDQMSDTITAWWRSIRPEELVDFGGVKRRAGGALFVNLIAALRADAASDPVEREALGVYSDSQLNALGLSIFLARTQLLGSPIVVLDDPIPGSDGDHRSTFVENTLGLLLDSGVQVVLCTFDGKLVQHARAIHDWRGLAAYDLTLLDATSGTEVTQTADTFSQLLLEAEDNLHSPTARSRRGACTSLRSAAERLAKQIIATGRTHDGQPTSVADVHAEAAVLGKLVPLACGYALDNAEKGQWRSFNTQLNPGNHDDDVPSTITLKQVRSNLRKIHKRHRSHWTGGLVL